MIDNLKTPSNFERKFCILAGSRVLMRGRVVSYDGVVHDSRSDGRGGLRQVLDLSGGTSLFCLCLLHPPARWGQEFELEQPYVFS